MRVRDLHALLSLMVTLALLATGCAGSRPLTGGQAVPTLEPAGIVEQTLVRLENPAQATKQELESVNVRGGTLVDRRHSHRMESAETVVAPGAQARRAHLSVRLHFSGGFLLRAAL